jgi:hypothetical protein
MKKSKLEAFNEKTAAVKDKAPAERRTRGQGDMVAITFRVPKRHWMRLQMVAMEEGISLQGLLIEGANKLLVGKGLARLA